MTTRRTEGETTEAAVPCVAVLGLGRAGTDLVHLLRDAGIEVSFAWSRNAAGQTVAGVPVTGGALPRRIDADVLLLAVPDRAITDVARRLAASTALPAGATVLHLSGATPAAAIRDGGVTAPCGAMHPLQTLVGDGHPPRPFGWVLEGDADALIHARRIVTRMGCSAVELSAENKPRYHAAAAMVSNQLVALARIAERQMTLAGLPSTQLPELFLPLMRTALAHVAQTGTAGALTGPLVRGDEATVAGHLEAMGDSPADLACYRALSAVLLEIAAERGLDVETVDRMRDLLAGRTCRPT